MYLSRNTRKALQPGLLITSTFLFAKTLRALWRCGDVMMFESLTLTPFCWRKPVKEKWYFKVQRTVLSSMQRSSQLITNNEIIRLRLIRPNTTPSYKTIGATQTMNQQQEYHSPRTHTGSQGHQGCVRMLEGGGGLNIFYWPNPCSIKGRSPLVPYIIYLSWAKKIWQPNR